MMSKLDNHICRSNTSKQRIKPEIAVFNQLIIALLVVNQKIINKRGDSA